MKNFLSISISLILFLNYLNFNFSCDLYIAPSKIHGIERGIFAGKKYKIGNIINTYPSILIEYEIIKRKQMSNYVFSSNNDRYSIAIFGAGMIFNHQNPKNVVHLYNEIPPIPSQFIPLASSQPYTTFPMLDFVAEQEILQYDEIFTSYGEDDQWFKSRNITFVPPNEMISTISNFKELNENGHCLTDVYVNTSNIPMSGKGLFTKRSYKKGEIVTISPILIFSKHTLQKLDDTSLLTNYAICSLISDVCILPIGLSSMINHGGVEANVEIEWYNWKSKTSLPEKLSWSIKDLAAYPAAPLDIAYRSTKDLNEGNEILISYGEEWEKEWLKYVQLLREWNREYVFEIVKNYEKPQFRHPIVEPKNLFPSHFHSVKCIDPSGCGNKKFNRRKRQLEMKDIKESKQYIEKYFRK